MRPGSANRYVPRTEHLLQQAGLMVQPPSSERPRGFRPKLRSHYLDMFGGVQQIPFQPAHVAVGAAQPQQRLRAEWHDLHDIPGQSVRADPAAGHELCSHPGTVDGTG